MLRVGEQVKCLSLPMHDNPFLVTPVLSTQLTFISKSAGRRNA